MTVQPETERLSKPLWSAGSQQRVDPYHCSRLAHIWCLNETNDLRQATGELVLHPQYTRELPALLNIHSLTLALYAYHSYGNLWKFVLYSILTRVSDLKIVQLLIVIVPMLLKGCFIHLFEIVKCWEDDLMTSSNQTDGSQQFKDQSFCPASTRHSFNIQITTTYLDEFQLQTLMVNSNKGAIKVIELLMWFKYPIKH